MKLIVFWVIMCMNTVRKGDIAELAIATDLVKRGYQVAIPFSSSSDWDLLLIRQTSFERIQVKYAEMMKNGTIPVRTRTHSNTSNQRTTRVYTSTEIDWLAVYCPDTDKCYYLPVDDLGCNELRLRVEPSRNNQSQNVRWASDYESLG